MPQTLLVAWNVTHNGQRLVLVLVLVLELVLELALVLRLVLGLGWWE